MCFLLRNRCQPSIGQVFTCLTAHPPAGYTWPVIEIHLNPQARKQLRKVPHHIALKLKVWVDSVLHEGLIETRKIPGLHDEPLKGNRKGQRSIRLSLSYRAIYTVSASGAFEIVTVEEVSKHDY